MMMTGFQHKTNDNLSPKTLLHSSCHVFFSLFDKQSSHAKKARNDNPQGLDRQTGKLTYRYFMNTSY